MYTILVSSEDSLLIGALRRQAKALEVIVLADSAGNAVAISKVQKPAVILLDLGQRIDGRELLARLKADEATRRIPVVIVASNDKSDAQDFCSAMGAVGFQVKPIGAFFEQLAKSLRAGHLPGVVASKIGLNRPSTSFT